MNTKQIEILEDQASLYASRQTTDLDEWEFIFRKKFAELIVRECVDICNKIYHSNYPDAEEWERSEEGDVIKQHFGVEE